MLGPTKGDHLKVCLKSSGTSLYIWVRRESRLNTLMLTIVNTSCLTISSVTVPVVSNRCWICLANSRGPWRRKEQLYENGQEHEAV